MLNKSQNAKLDPIYYYTTGKIPANSLKVKSRDFPVHLLLSVVLKSGTCC